MLRSTLRSLASAAVLVAVYYWLPFDRSPNSSALVRLALGIIAFIAVLAWQVRAITEAAYPRIRAVESLFLTVPLLVLLFASTYFIMARSSSANFAQALTRTDALYFTVTVLSTVGFGDISAKSDTARIVVTVQMLVDLVLIGLGVRILLNATERGLSRRDSSSDGSDAPDDRHGGPATD